MPATARYSTRLWPRHRDRIETEALAALRWRGLQPGKIVDLYPVLEPADVEDALDLERQLQPDLALAA